MSVSTDSRTVLQGWARTMAKATTKKKKKKKKK
jgi:hypothetical protein